MGVKDGRGHDMAERSGDDPRRQAGEDGFNMTAGRT